MNHNNASHYEEQTNIKEIDLKQYFLLIKKRFWIIIVMTVISTLAGYYYSHYNNAPIYESSTRMILGSGSEDMSTLMVMIKDPIVMEKVVEELQLERSAGAIADQITVSQVDESQVVQISVTDSDPEMAADLANATAATYKTEIKDILGFTEVQLLSEAKTNTASINAASSNLTIITFVSGLIVGLGIIFLIDSLDAKIRKESEVEALLGVPVLGTVSNMNKREFAVKKQSPMLKQMKEGEVYVKQNT
ncbi:MULTISPECIES: YveK family protein [Gracilibacillus]|uniref:YveK family protein n=1 Tax=Gracilibacillus TaxID=74385 RepID=UPI000826E512|nr:MULTISPECIES: Wzz/FepE/Etk N-terminal domain-containing protein [Gracilibacillus]